MNLFQPGLIFYFLLLLYVFPFFVDGLVEILFILEQLQLLFGFADIFLPLLLSPLQRLQPLESLKFMGCPLILYSLHLFFLFLDCLGPDFILQISYLSAGRLFELLSGLEGLMDPLNLVLSEMRSCWLTRRFLLILLGLRFLILQPSQLLH